jgi:hypothetical protein
MSYMDSPTPRFHVLIGTTLGAPWEGDVDAANVCDALDEGLRRYLGNKSNVDLARQVLIRRLPDKHG